MLVEEQELIPFTTSDIVKGKWLVFAPHADDETFGMGGSLLLAKQQHVPVSLVIMTDGGMGTTETDKDICKIRENEVQQVVDFLALKSYHWLGEKDRGLGISNRLIEKIATLIKSEKPDQIFIPSPMELHPDHRATAELVCQSLIKLDNNSDIYCYEISVQTQINRLIDISSVIEKKQQLMSIYQSQIGQNNYQDVILALNKARTFTLANNETYAEGFTKIDLNNKHSLSEFLFQQLLPFWQITAKAVIPLVSIIIRAKDHPELLQRSVQSVLEQMYPNIELVVVNDGACDVELDRDILTRNLAQFQYIKIEQNGGGGRAGAANVGLRAFKGDYALFLNDGDTIDSNHIIQLIRIIEEKCADVVYSGVRTDNGTLINQEFDQDLLYSSNYIPIQAVIFSKKLIKAGCSFDENFTMHEDWDFLLQMMQQTTFYHSDVVTAANLASESNSELLIKQQYQLKLYAKWGKLWQPEALNKIFSSADKYYLEKSSPQDNRGIKIRQLEQKISAQAQVLEQRLAQNHNLQHEIDSLNMDRQQQDQQLQNIYQCFSWRITKPLRIIRKLSRN
jgi:LmbE family N-acetylglucosaminyl deacetylase